MDAKGKVLTVADALQLASRKGGVLFVAVTYLTL
jgi:hypothetical protein